jgi:tetratricopeptide (TPR) repeat protein
MNRRLVFLVMFIAGVMMVGQPPHSLLAQEKKAEEKPAAAEKKEGPAFLNAWKQIQSTVNKKRTSKTTEGVATAGVRGAEAEDQIVNQMYFRGGSTYPTRTKIQNAILLLNQTIQEAPDPASTAETRFYIAQCYVELGEKDKAIAAYKEVINVASKSEWAAKAKDEIKLLEAK